VLGYVVSPNRRWLRNDNGYRFARKLKRYAYRYSIGQTDLEIVSASVRSWIGHSMHAETFALRRQLFERVVFCPLG